ncbi:TetR family transcriptional regulator [Pseudodesulfovibrio sp. F-1]|uniref:TetR family transcriptional regulator n=1 Tax=Pseudodesulfovibrio alkaliphilus TaxID=2661613 RepID=A0A7K1KP12_9BACT|nr:TetR/AcrR family transcriptional regulator [Pseudodesulfovibrio alkaliphilus]MUM77632.1 TetR family transcriptional regulator [Pseudodesulfovibrio alkaliphilus]
MIRKTRRERDRGRMRRLVLDAARQLFVREGFDNVSMRRIAGAIGYSPAAIYRYFRNKREILSTLRAEGFDRYVAGQRARAAQWPDLLTRVREEVVAYLRFAMEEPEYYHLMFCADCDEVELEGALAASSQESHALVQEIMDQAVAAGVFGEVDAQVVTLSLWAGVHGLAQLIRSGRVALLAEGADLESLVDGVMDFMLRPGWCRCGGGEAE